MYNKELIEKLVSFIQQHDGTADKRLLSAMVQDAFHLERSRSVYFCPDFAIRFSQSQRERMSNTVLSLSALQKYDSIPFIVCIVTPAKKLSDAGEYNVPDQAEPFLAELYGRQHQRELQRH